MSTIGTQIRRRVHDGLVADIRRQIQAGKLSANHYLLSERELARKYDISSRAVREGLASLEAEGLIQRYQGRGTIVLPVEVKNEQANKSKNVAVIFQGRVSDASTAEELDALQQAFQREGYGTTLYVADGVPETETAIVEQLSADGVAGLVLYSAHSVKRFEHLQKAMAGGMKVVVYDHDFPGLGCNFVGIDDGPAAFEAAEHLIRLGCREMVFINSQRDWTTSVERQRGFEEAVEKWVVPSCVVQMQPAYGSMEERKESLREKLVPILDEARRPLGILAWWDEISLLAMDCLREAGWSVPNEAKVMGIGNDRSGAAAEIGLTTMEIPRREIMRLAAAALVDQMRFPERPAQRIRLKARIIIRESCGNYTRGQVDRDSLVASALTTP